jgi:hypothetical protein
MWHAAAAHAEERVGDWGEPSRIVVEGVKSFSADSIRSALMANFDVLEAGHPRAPLEEYPKLLAEKTKNGYLKAGFPDAKVEARIDEKKKQIILTVDEGQQFRCGEITLSGTTYFDPVQVRTWLLSKQPPAGAVLAAVSQVQQGEVAQWINENGEEVELQSPAWQVGEPVRFDEQGRKSLEENVRRTLAELGCRWAKVEIVTPQNPVDHVAPLQINIADAGPPAVVGKISVIGNQRDSDEDVINYLGIKPGTMLTESERTRLWYLLWMSGRYLEQDIDLIAPDQPSSSVELQITVAEYDQASPISQPLSAAEEALMKCRQWILDNEKRRDDWVCRFTGPYPGCVVVSPKQGLLCHGAPSGDPPGAAADCDQGLPEFLLKATPNEVLYADAAATKKLMLPHCEGLRLYCKLDFLVDASDPEHPRRFTFATGFSSSDDSTASGISLRTTISPTHMISLAHLPDSEVKIEDGLLTVNSNGLEELRVDVRTGRLVKVCTPSGDDSPAPASEITLEQGAFERELAAAEAQLATQAKDSAFNPARPLGSIVEFLAGDPLITRACHLLAKDVEQEKTIDGVRVALRDAIAASLLSPIDGALVAWRTKPSDDEGQKGDEFSVPNEFEALQGWDALSMFLIQQTITRSDDVFPRNSWPWTLVRDLALWETGRSKYCQGDVNELWASKDFGPLGYLSLATIFSMSDNPARSDTLRSIGEYGLTKFFVEDFEREVRPLLDQSKLAGKCVCHLARVLREMDEDDATALGSLFLGDRGNLLGNVACWLKSLRDEPMEKVLPEVLNEAWSAGLRSIVEQRLRAIAGIPFEPVKMPLERAQSEDQSKEKSGSPGSDPPEAQRDLDYHLPGHIEVK